MSARTTQRPRRGMLAIAALLVVSLLMAACGGGNGADGDGAADAPEDKDPITIGLIPWDEDIAVTHLWEVLLEDRGYEVEIQQVDVAPVFAGVADGQLDLFLDAWLPNTHEDYWDEYGDEVADLGVWYHEAPLTWVVPSYVDEVDSIADLQGNADMFGGEIIGIEPGSGLMRISRTEVMPTYDLEDEYRLVEGSTSAMLASLQSAVQNEEPVLVTLWQPHYAYAEFDIKNLEDPENALGDPDELHAIARQGFADEYPDVAQWIENFELENQPLAQLEVELNEAGEGGEREAVEGWLEENQDIVDAWFEG